MNRTDNIGAIRESPLRSGRPVIVAENAAVAIHESPLQAGQRIQATLREQVSPGLFKVQVAGQLMQMRLPGQLQTGSVLELQVVSTSPKLTFSVFASTNPIATQEQISATSRLLANLAELPLERTLIQSTAGKPVWQATGLPTDSKQLAAALRDALANSGLFYESHQAQWVRGERSTAQLLIEPQNQWPGRDTQPTDKPGEQPSAAQQGKAATDSGLPIARELVSLVQQQLHTLETHQLTWTGQVWPGQEMQWEIQGQPEQDTLLPDERQWSTEMELALPRLGDVHARLVFNQNGVKLTLQAADAGSVALFNHRLPGLAMTLANAGIPLTASVVEKV